MAKASLPQSIEYGALASVSSVSERISRITETQERFHVENSFQNDNLVLPPCGDPADGPSVNCYGRQRNCYCVLQVGSDAH
jgi:hypothetical protein